MSGDVRVARSPGLWLWFSLLPFGLGSWAPVVAGMRCRDRRWTAMGVIWVIVGVAGWVIAAVEPSGGEELVGGLIVFSWAGGIVTSFAIRSRYMRRRRGRSVKRTPWPTPTARSREWSVRYALAAYAVTFVGVNAVAAAFYFGLDVRLRVGPGVLLVDGVLLGALWPLRRRGLTRQDLGLRAAPGVRSVGLVVLALVVYGVIGALWVIVVQPRTGVEALANVKHESTIDAVLAIVAVAVSAPIVEEIFFRGLLYRSLRNRLSIVPAVLIAGVLFGFVHITSYPLDTLPVKTAFGVIACLLYERTGSLLPGIGLHAFVDASAVDVALTGSDQVVIVCSLLVVIAVIVGAWVRKVPGERRAIAIE